MVWGFSRFVPFLFLGLLRAPTWNTHERVRDAIWIFPEKCGKLPGLDYIYIYIFFFPGLAALKCIYIYRERERVVEGSEGVVWKGESMRTQPTRPWWVLSVSRSSRGSCYQQNMCQIPSRIANLFVIVLLLFANDVLTACQMIVNDCCFHVFWFVNWFI